MCVSGILFQPLYMHINLAVFSSSSSFGVYYANVCCENKGRTSFCNLCANAKEQNPKMGWCRRAFENSAEAEQGLILPFSQHAYISCSPLLLCVYINLVYRLLNAKTSIEQRCWFDLCYSYNVRVNGHTTATTAALVARGKFLAHRVQYTHIAHKPPCARFEL